MSDSFETPVDCSWRGSSVHPIFQARILQWVAISFSRGLPDPWIEPSSLALQVDSLPLSHQGSLAHLKISLMLNIDTCDIYACVYIYIHTVISIKSYY